MKIIVYPHDLNMGGSQLNAIELAAAVRDRGHEVVVFGRPGSLVDYVEELGLEFVRAPEPRKRPSLRIARALRELAVERGADILHGYEWPPALEAVYASRIGAPGVPIATVMSMAMPPFIPRRMWLIAGTAEIADFERRLGRRRTAVMEPPVDTEANHPGGHEDDVAAFRREHGLDADALTVVVICRLVQELKLEGILSAIDGVPILERAGTRVQLVIVGDGAARDLVSERAAAVNADLGRDAVVLTGQLSDPRPAYASADVMLGMGGSALRSLAFAKPLIVQGEQGYWKLLTPESESEFLWQGWYGYGDDPRAGTASLVDALRQLEQGSRRLELGDYGRQLVVRRFSLQQAAERQERIYADALAERQGRAALAASDARALTRYAGYYVGKRVRRALGRERTDDFNATPVAARAKEQSRRA